MKRTDCIIYGTELCGFVGSEGCDKCFVNDISDKKQDEAIEAANNWRVTLSNIPQDIDELHTGDECLFCRGEAKKATKYAMVDLAHPEPEYKKGMFLGFGKKVRNPIGSIIQVPVSVCPRCARLLKISGVLRILGIAIGLILAMLMIMIESFGMWLESIGWWAPFLYFVLMLVAGWGVGEGAERILEKYADRTMHTNVLKLPMFVKLQQLGWFPLQADKAGRPHISVMKKKPREGYMFYGEFTPKKAEKPVDTTVE